MRYFLLFLFSIVLAACSSSPNPLSKKTNEATIDTIIVTDTVMYNDTAYIVEKDTICKTDSVFVLDTITKIDTVFEQGQEIFSRTQFANCVVRFEKQPEESSYEYVLYVKGFVACVNEELVDDYEVERITVNNVHIIPTNTGSGTASFSYTINRYSAPHAIDIKIITSAGDLEGSIESPSLERINPYFGNIKIKDRKQYITVDDSLHMAWNSTEDDFYRVSYSYNGTNLITGDIIEEHVDTLVSSTKLTFKHNYFDRVADGYLYDISIVGNKGSRYGNPNNNLVGAGVGWISAYSTSTPVNTKVYVYYNQP